MTLPPTPPLLPLLPLPPPPLLLRLLPPFMEPESPPTSVGVGPAFVGSGAIAGSSVGEREAVTAEARRMRSDPRPWMGRGERSR